MMRINKFLAVGLLAIISGAGFASEPPSMVSINCDGLLDPAKKTKCADEKRNFTQASHQIVAAENDVHQKKLLQRVRQNNYQLLKNASQVRGA